MELIMSRLHHKCPDCDSEFTITYRIENCEDDPIYCPFCASYLLDDQNEEDFDEFEE